MLRGSERAEQSGSPGLLRPIRRPWLAQSLYYAVTGIWPLISMRSFQWVTGPKADGWLVKTVGLILAVIGGVIGLAGRRRRLTPELRWLGIGSAASLAGIDVVYVARRRISPVYLLDAAVNLALIAGWLYASPAAALGSGLLRPSSQRWRRSAQAR